MSETEKKKKDILLLLFLSLKRNINTSDVQIQQSLAIPLVPSKAQRILTKLSLTLTVHIILYYTFS